MTFQEIVDAINGHLTSSGLEYGDCYVGITKDIQSRLFGDHKVPEKDHWRIHKTADSDDIARDVEVHFQNLGMKGDTGGGGQTSNIVYAYKISGITDP